MIMIHDQSLLVSILIYKTGEKRYRLTTLPQAVENRDQRTAARRKGNRELGSNATSGHPVE